MDRKPAGDEPILRVAVVGHVEWVEFISVEHVPAPGEIVHGIGDFQIPAGGGAVAAVQLFKLAGNCTFFTAFGDDDIGHRAAAELAAMGLEVRGVFRRESQRRAITFVDSLGERTITVLGDRHGPRGEDALSWEDLGDFDGVYVTAGDDSALRAARRARVVVATSRILPELQAAGLRLDAIVGSASDPAERYLPRDLTPEPHLVVRTEGATGGTWRLPGSGERRYRPGEKPPTPGDAYGSGDSFAAALTFALARGDVPGAALGFASDCGAAVAGAMGPYAGQITL